MERLNKFKEKEQLKINKKVQYVTKQNTKYLDQEQEGYIQTEDGEFSNKFSQEQIKEYLPNYNKNCIFDLTLPKGPFHIDFSSNGQKMLLHGRESSAIMSWKTKDLLCEVSLPEERIHSGKFINNDNMFALSQEESLNIYDLQGIEIHNLQQHSKPRFLENLPYHFLIVWSTKNK